MKTDIEIASEQRLKAIDEIASNIGIKKEELYHYGNYMAKTEPKDGKADVILVTAINPTTGGEGKTTISIGLADAMKLENKKVCLALREPSLGPVFGMKGGATGGGYSQIAPMDDINLHFTGDLHAITSANNLLSAMIDNHIYWGNELKIKSVYWHRCQDVNDRALRNVITGLNFGIVREDAFDITAASEIMAVLCLCRDIDDLKTRLGNIVIGENSGGNYVTAKDLKANEAMTILLKDAVKPNLVQTLGGVPAFVHGGPFANIAHGCNSIIATKTAMHYSDYVVTEAGFGADLGAEKFLDIKCRIAGIEPSCVVIVATVRALKALGGKKEKLAEKDNEALYNGLPNLIKHIENITKIFRLNCVVAINKFETDFTEEIEIVKQAAEKSGVKAVCASVWANGGKGGADLAKEVIRVCENKTGMSFAYNLNDSVKNKIGQIAEKIYGANAVKFEPKAIKSIEKIESSGFGNLPVCIAKTQYSLSDNPTLIGRPSGFSITVRDVSLRAGAGFVVALAGDILLMPGLSRIPNAENMSINKGIIKGLF